MISRSLAAAVFLGTSLPGLAQTPEPSQWQAIRDQQPKELRLQMELPKTTFHLGEVIDAKLIFSNDSDKPYYLWIGTYDRSGRIPDIAFVAVDEQGKPLTDPLKWYLDRAFLGGGLGNFQELGKWDLTLPANQWLHFDKPGTYEIFAFSNRVKPGNLLSRYQNDPTRFPLVSDKVKVRIIPLSEERESEIITEALREMKGNGDPAQRGANTLRYLNTPRARAALLPFLGTEFTYSVYLAFAATADPVAEAERIYDAVASGKIKLNREAVDLYTLLKTSSTAPFELMTKHRELNREHEERITQAAAQASGHHGTEYYQTLLVSLQRDPRKENPARAELLKVQTELTPQQMEEILNGWEGWGGADFLPLIRRAVQAPAFSFTALKILASLKPAEARPLVIEDLQREQPRYLQPNAVPKLANVALLSLPAAPIPELEAFFRRQLAAGDQAANPDLLLPAIDRYGTPALLPDVVAFYQRHEGEWACELQNAALRFWIRADRPAGLKALVRALDSRESTGCYHTVLREVLLPHWGKDALPLATQRLADPDPQVAESAMEVLEKKAGAEWLEPSVQAAERLSASTRKEDDAFYAARRMAQHLLQSERWPLSPEQKKRLEAIIALIPTES